MTIDTDLATLWAPVVWGQAQTDALKRVEAALRDKDAEIERLRADSAAWERAAKAYATDVQRHRDRARAAERELAGCQRTLEKVRKNSEGIERELARLQEGLWEVLDEIDLRAEENQYLMGAAGRARALLADTAAQQEPQS